MSRLRRNVRSSVAWAGAEGVVNVLAALCTTLVVARIIGPTEFGLAAIAYLLGTLAEIIVFTPFVDPLIQRRRLDRPLSGWSLYRDNCTRRRNLLDYPHCGPAVGRAL